MSQEPEKQEPKKNPVAEKYTDFKETCEGLNTDTIEKDFRKTFQAQEQADMLKKRAKILYRHGQISRSQYHTIKAHRSEIGAQFNRQYFCLQARAEYLKAVKKVL